MRPFIFIIGVFGFVYTLWSFVMDATGSETSIIAGIAYDFYGFGRIFYAPPDPLSEYTVYLIVAVFFLVIFLAMILMGVFGKGEKK